MNCIVDVSEASSARFCPFPIGIGWGLCARPVASKIVAQVGTIGTSKWSCLKQRLARLPN